MIKTPKQLSCSYISTGLVTQSKGLWPLWLSETHLVTITIVITNCTNQEPHELKSVHAFSIFNMLKTYWKSFSGENKFEHLQEELTSL